MRLELRCTGELIAHKIRSPSALSESSIGDGRLDANGVPDDVVNEAVKALGNASEKINIG